MRAKFTVADESSRKFSVLYESFHGDPTFYAIFGVISCDTRGLSGVKGVSRACFNCLSLSEICTNHMENITTKSRTQFRSGRRRNFST